MARNLRIAGSPHDSIAAEFLGTQAKVTGYDRPLLETTSLPTFEQRLYIIGKNLADYKRFEPLMNRFRKSRNN